MVQAPVALRVDVDTRRGLREGVPRLLEPVTFGLRVLVGHDGGDVGAAREQRRERASAERVISEEDAPAGRAHERISATT